MAPRDKSTPRATSEPAWWTDTERGVQHDRWLQSQTQRTRTPDTLPPPLALEPAEHTVTGQFRLDDEEEVTKPTDLIAALGGDRDAKITAGDLEAALGILWDRIDRVKIQGARQRRATSEELAKRAAAPSSTSKTTAARVKIMWYLLTAALIAAGGSTVTVIKFLMTKGGDDMERSLTLRGLVESTSDHGRRLRLIEDDITRTLQRLDDYFSGHRDRNDAVTGATPLTKGTKQ